MTSFTLHLQSVARSESITDVESFIATDESGSFGLMAQHANFMTAVDFGLARYRCKDKDWEYLAIPGGLVHFKQDNCYVVTREYVRSADYLKISRVLTEQLRATENNLQQLKTSLQNLEQEMMRRIWEMRRAGVSAL